MSEESSDTTNLSNNNENELPNPPKKSRSVSDAERRRARRERKILGDAGSRLHRITSTHSSSLNAAVGETSSTLSSPYVSRKSSPQPSQKSSPQPSQKSSPQPSQKSSPQPSPPIEAPENPFLPRRRSAGNLEPLTPTHPDGTSERTFPHIRVSDDAEHSDLSGGLPPQNIVHEDIYYSVRPPISSPTPIPTTASILGEEENGYLINNNDEQLRQILGSFANYQARNSSTTSLASTVGGSEYQFLTAQDEFIQQDILQQQQQFQQQFQQIPLPFQQFFNPFGNVSQQQNIDLQSKLWQVIHFCAMILLGCSIFWSEYSREKGAWTKFYLLNYERPEDIIATERIPPMRVFWYFITVELMLQSSKIFFQQDQVFQNSKLVQFARKFPAPFSDVFTVLLKYNLIWNSLWEDLCMLVSIVGFIVTISPFISYFA